MRLKIVGRITDRQHPKCLYNKLVLLPKFGKGLNIGNSDYNGDYQRKEKRAKSISFTNYNRVSEGFK